MDGRGNCLLDLGSDAKHFTKPPSFHYNKLPTHLATLPSFLSLHHLNIKRSVVKTLSNNLLDMVCTALQRVLYMLGLLRLKQLLTFLMLLGLIDLCFTFVPSPNSNPDVMDCFDKKLKSSGYLRK